MVVRRTQPRSCSGVIGDGPKRLAGSMVGSTVGVQVDGWRVGVSEVGKKVGFGVGGVGTGVGLRVGANVGTNVGICSHPTHCSKETEPSC